jgi:hypothetical protein
VVERTFFSGSPTPVGWTRTIRDVVRHRRGVHLCGDESAADGEAVGPCVGVLRQSLKRGYRKLREQMRQ